MRALFSFTLGNISYFNQGVGKNSRKSCFQANCKCQRYNSMYHSLGQSIHANLRISGGNKCYDHQKFRQGINSNGYSKTYLFFLYYVSGNFSKSIGGILLKFSRIPIFRVTLFKFIRSSGITIIWAPALIKTWSEGAFQQILKLIQNLCCRGAKVNQPFYLLIKLFQ